MLSLANNLLLKLGKISLGHPLSNSSLTVLNVMPILIPMNQELKNMIFKNILWGEYAELTKTLNVTTPVPEVIKLFSWSTQLSTNFQLPIKTKILTNEEVSCFMSETLRCCIYHANKC